MTLSYVENAVRVKIGTKKSFAEKIKFTSPHFLDKTTQKSAHVIKLSNHFFQTVNKAVA